MSSKNLSTEINRKSGTWVTLCEHFWSGLVFITMLVGMSFTNKYAKTYRGGQATLCSASAKEDPMLT